MNIDRRYEIPVAKLAKDVRPGTDRILDSLFKPGNYRSFLIAFIALQLWLPGLWPIWLIGIGVLILFSSDRQFTMPLRGPKDIPFVDRSEYTEELVAESRLWGLLRSTRTVKRYALTAGILYLGYLRTNDKTEQGRELWFTNPDARTHLFVTGTTGSGKSKALMGIAYNALCWGSGYSYGDGKADSSLPFYSWASARKLGREDDFLVLNYLTGGEDPIAVMVERERNLTLEKVKLSQSNSTNPFADGSADFLLQLMGSLLPTTDGKGDWQQKAMNLIDALLRTLCYKRAKGELDISIAIIRHYLALTNLVELYLEGRDGKIPELAYLPIKAYFETALPGFIPALAHDSSKWDQEVFNQHGYLTGQFARILSMMMDSYGFIFSDRYADIDQHDVLVNDRILVTMIPSLEKSADEAASIGKITSSATRLMMAKTLGYELEGLKTEVLDTKATNAPNPYIIIMDELAYWYAQGTAIQFAQGRSLGFMMVAAVQDVQGLKRGEAGAEAASLIACTKIKLTLALEDPDETYDLLRKAGGEAYYSLQSGHDATSGAFSTSYEAQSVANVQRHDRIDLRSLKSLQKGEGLVLFGDAVVPMNAFYISDESLTSPILPMRINRFLQIERPSMDKLPKSAVFADPVGREAVAHMLKTLSAGEKPRYPTLDDPILDAVRNAADHLDMIDRFPVTATERGIVLFEAARRALKKSIKAGQEEDFHSAIPTEPVALIPDGDDSIPDDVYETI